MTTLKSFAKGSAFPARSQGTLRLYSMRFCPFAQRARLVLEHKEIPYETVNVNLSQKPEWLLERNPLGMVPVLEQDDKLLYESLVVCDYLEDVYPNNRLTPTDPYRKARDAMLVDFYGNKFISNYYKALRAEGKNDEANEAMIKALHRLEEELTARGKFFGGDKVAMVDMMLWPWIERLGVFQRCVTALVPSESNFPILFAWTQAMLQQPAVKATFLDARTHLKFYLSYRDGKADYDVGLEP